MLAKIFDDENDSLHDEIETTVSLFYKDKIKNYFKNLKNKDGKTIMEIHDSFPSNEDLKFINHAELVSVLDYCYPLLEDLSNKEDKDSETITKDIRLVIGILNNLCKNNFPKSFSAGMLYYEIRHLYG